MNMRLVVLTLCCLALAARVITAQDDEIDPEACVALVQQAYEVTQDACVDTGRDEACYGNVLLDAAPDTLSFAQTGDVVSVADIESLRLSSMNTERGEWGVSLMRLRANLPEDDTAQNVELLLFGNVSIANQTETVEAAPPVPTLDITAGGNINVRSIPTTSGSIVGVLNPGVTITTDGRNEAGDWVRVNLAGEGETPEYGWVFVSLFTVDGDVTTLNVVDPNAAPEAVVEETPTPIYGPMQAFFFTSEADDRPCAEAPDSGLLIQTPDGAGVVDFLVNEVAISLGSTAYLQAVPSDAMLISVVEGSATVTALGVTVQAPAGTRVRVALGADGLPVSGPILESYSDEDVATLPVQLLMQPIVIQAGLDENELQVLPYLPVIGSWAGTFDIVDCDGAIMFEGFDYNLEISVNEAGELLVVNSDNGLVLAPQDDGSFVEFQGSFNEVHVRVENGALVGEAFISMMTPGGEAECQPESPITFESAG